MPHRVQLGLAYICCQWFGSSSEHFLASNCVPGSIPDPTGKKGRKKKITMVNIPDSDVELSPSAGVLEIDLVPNPQQREEWHRECAEMIADFQVRQFHCSMCVWLLLQECHEFVLFRTCLMARIPGNSLSRYVLNYKSILVSKDRLIPTTSEHTTGPQLTLRIENVTDSKLFPRGCGDHASSVWCNDTV